MKAQVADDMLGFHPGRNHITVPTCMLISCRSIIRFFQTIH